MNVVHPCRCCLRRAPDTDLTTPYTHFGTTEIYSDMLKACFEIHVILGGDGECGICEVCVGRLRDASDFKLQVQRSQAELQARLERALFVAYEEPAVKSERADDDDAGSENKTVSYERPIEKTEMAYGSYVNETGEDMLYKRRHPLVPHSLKPSTREEDCTSQVPVTDAAGAGAEGEPARAREQLAMAGSARLERFRGDEAPHASQTSRIKTQKINRYLCELCNKTFVNIILLKVHKIIHKKKSPFSCEECKTQFRNKRNLNAHVRLHTRVPYNCEECGEQFTQEHRLDKHKRIHTGDKPYSCEECNKQFTRKDTLDIHKKRIHTKEKPHSCDECKKQFTKKYSLDIHKRTHTGIKPYSCEICDKQFTIKHHLDIHKRIHTGEKPYNCEECNKQFTRKDNLDLHKRIHTGEKPYHCKECDKYYTCKSSLNKHQKNHTG